MSFISYKPINNDEKCLGVATVEYTGPIVLRYRLVPNKTGGNFLAAPAIKIDDKWHDGFEIDSTRKKLEIEEMIRHNINNQHVLSQQVTSSNIPFNQSSWNNAPPASSPIQSNEPEEQGLPF